MRFPWRAALGVLLSAGLLAWALHGVQWSDVGHNLAGSNAGLWVLSIVASQCVFPLRAWRWRPILESAAPDLPFTPLWRATVIGMMANNVLPGRLGELARAYTLHREVPSVRFSTGIASLVVDRTFDALVVLTLLAFAMFTPSFRAAAPVGSSTMGAAILVTSAVVIAAFAVLFTTVFAPAFVENVAGAVTSTIAPSWEARARSLVHSLAAGLGALRNPRRFGIVFLWTLVHWLVNAFAHWLGFRAIGIDVPFTAALFVQGVIVLAVAVPSMPGFIGVFETGAVIALAHYGVVKADALSWAIVYHGLSFIPVTLLGAWYLARMGLSLGEIRRAPSVGSA